MSRAHVCVILFGDREYGWSRLLVSLVGVTRAPISILCIHHHSLGNFIQTHSTHRLHPPPVIVCPTRVHMWPGDNKHTHTHTYYVYYVPRGVVAVMHYGLASHMHLPAHKWVAQQLRACNRVSDRERSRHVGAVAYMWTAHYACSNCKHTHYTLNGPIGSPQ